MITPHDYQRKALNDTYTQFKTHRKGLLCLPTAAGKTFCFSFLTRFWRDKKKEKVLVLCHRTELIEQTIASMNQIGVTCESVFASKKLLKHNSDCLVSMVETAFRRLKRNPSFFGKVGLVIADECHIDLYQRVFDFFPNAKILGVTATPVSTKRVTFYKCRYCKSEYNEITNCCDQEVDEWTKPKSLSDYYEFIVVGPSIEKLIEKGNLVRELSFVKDYVSTDNLETDSDGQFTNKSIDDAYSNDDAAFNCLLNYQEICVGKKTMVFNGTTKNNLIVYKKFLEAGLNVRMYDSVNTDESGCRKELINWFRTNDDAILLNCGVFTTGFDVKEVEAIILNFATASLSLFIQICGRGARSTDMIYKPHFLLVDGGGNIARHLEFSDPTRDWERIFWEGIGKAKPKKQDAMDIQSCPDCGDLYLKSEPSCPECGFVILPLPPKEKLEKEESESVLAPIRKIPPPNGESIYQYTLKRGEDINFAFKIMISQIVDLFKFYRVSLDTYASTKVNGKLDKRLKEIIRKCYFTLLSKKDIQTEGRRTLAHLLKRTIEKLDKYYDI